MLNAHSLPIRLVTVRRADLEVCCGGFHLHFCRIYWATSCVSRSVFPRIYLARRGVDNPFVCLSRSECNAPITTTVPPWFFDL